jgi:hypothetical protein
MASADEWSTAYARQAKVDFDAWDYLQDLPLPECQQLHFIQMACEKLAKAHLCEAGSRPEDLQGSHAYIAATLPVILRDQLQLSKAKPAFLRTLLRFAKHLAREIELLSPAVDDGGRRPDNCEYPWEDTGKKLWIPAEYSSSPTNCSLNRMGEPCSNSFMRLFSAWRLDRFPMRKKHQRVLQIWAHPIPSAILGEHNQPKTPACQRQHKASQHHRCADDEPLLRIQRSQRKEITGPPQIHYQQEQWQ